MALSTTTPTIRELAIEAGLNPDTFSFRDFASSNLNYNELGLNQTYVVGLIDSFRDFRGYSHNASPPVPTGLADSYDTGSDYITFNWGDMYGAVSYTILWEIGDMTPELNSVTVTSSTKSIYIGQTSSTQTVYWRVKSNGQHASSNYSSVYSYAIPASITIPSVPTGLVGSYNDMETTLGFNWNAVSGATSYGIKWEVGDSTPDNYDSVSNNSHYEVYDPGFLTKTCYFQVRATNSLGSSAYSAVQSFTVSAQGGQQ